MKKLLSTLALSVSLVSAAQAVDIVDTAVAAGNKVDPVVKTIMQ